MHRPWTEIDREAPRPSLDEVEASRRDLRFSPVPVNSPAASGLVETLRSILTNGAVLLAAFMVHDVDDTAHWFLSRNRFDEFGFITRFLTSEAIASALPDLAPIDKDAVEATFKESSSLLLDGQLAGALVFGGAYGKFTGSAAEARRLALNVRTEVIGDRYEECRVDLSRGSWSPWFRCVAWDGTWIVTDKRNQRVTMLCITDTD